MPKANGEATWISHGCSGAKNCHARGAEAQLKNPALPAEVLILAQNAKSSETIRAAKMDNV